MPKQIEEPVLSEVARPTVAGIRSLWSSYPSANLTPAKLSSILREADAGDHYRQMELFEELEEKDAHIFSCLQTRKLSVANLDYQVLPPKSGREAAKITQFVQESLDRLELEQALIDLLDALGKGFSVLEIMWEVKQGAVAPEKLAWRHQKWFRPEETGEGFRLLSDAEPIRGEYLPPDKFIIHQYRARSGVASRGGILRVVVWMYLFKHYAVKDWVSFAEVFGMPLRLGKYPAGSSENDREVLLQAVVNLAQDAAAIIPEGMSIEFVEAAKSASVNFYEGLARFCNQEISKAVLGQTLTTENVGSGSYALGKVHQEVRHDLMEADARALSQTITTQLVRPLVEYNFGPQSSYPNFNLLTSKSEPAREKELRSRI